MNKKKMIALGLFLLGLSGRRNQEETKEILFEIKENKSKISAEVLAESYKEKHKKQMKPFCPKNILNKNYNSKKRGGR